jgi:hypothetical protein
MDSHDGKKSIKLPKIKPLGTLENQVYKEKLSNGLITQETNINKLSLDVSK